MFDVGGATLRAVTGQIDWWWNAIFRPRLAGLADDEFLWQPVPDCWTIHDAGDGVLIDFEWPPPQPAPVTTIAWRLCHIGIGCLAQRTSSLFPDVADTPVFVPMGAREQPFPARAEAALDFLDHWWTLWRRGLDEGGEDGLWRPIGDIEDGIYVANDFSAMQLGGDDPRIGLVMHIHRELMHHGAEVGVLRDLYGAQHG
ncbi:MAG TPA: hypothetical protein VFB78_05690 [Acidimicrobiales bacterium]|nr:hypothetical protein [Acidimicrobiales bacterium]